MPSSDEVKQSITNWCSSDDDLEITSDRFEPGTNFAFGLKSGTLSSAPVDLVVLQDDGADRVTIRRTLTLSGDNVSAANELIASRPGSVTAAVERSGGDTSVVAQTYVYLDGLEQAHLRAGSRGARSHEHAARCDQPGRWPRLSTTPSSRTCRTTAPRPTSRLGYRGSGRC